MFKRSLWAAIAGTALEGYDTALYVFFAAYLGPLFFPSENYYASLFASYGALAAGFVTRPLGGLLFGHFGDRLGRKKMMVYALFLVTVPTLIIGLLPTFAQIGMLAPIILVCCRLLHGVAFAGEFTGGSIFVIEQAQKGRAAFAGSILGMSVWFGFLLAAGVAAITTMPLMPSWAWRLAFIIGALWGWIGFYIRLYVDESPIFQQAKNANKIVSYPLLNVIKENTRNFMCTIAIGPGGMIPSLLGLYLINEVGRQLMLPASQVMLINTLNTFFWMAVMPGYGYLADIVTPRRVMQGAAIAMIVVPFPLFMNVLAAPSVPLLIIGLMCLALIGGAFLAPSTAFLSSLFPVTQRYSGMAVGYNIGVALLGGTTPQIALLLTTYFKSGAAPSFYIMIEGCIALTALCYAHLEAYDAPSLQMSTAPESRKPALAL